MNWGLVFRLSLFGLGMALMTAYIIPASVEPFLWLAIFVACAYLIAKRAPGRLFLHGFALGIVNSVWITAAHVLLLDDYLARHAKEAEMMRSMPMPFPPRVMMAIIGPCVGIVTGIVIGLFALAAARFVGRGSKATATS